MTSRPWDPKVSIRSNRDRALALAECLGIHIENRDAQDSWEWDGASMAMWDGGRARDARTLIHDMAHYLGATPRRRLRPEFGLGTGPGGGQPARCYISGFASDTEEAATCILACAMERLTGFDEDESNGGSTRSVGNPYDYYSLSAFGFKRKETQLLRKRRCLKALESVFGRDSVRREMSYVMRRIRSEYRKHEQRGDD